MGISHWSPTKLQPGYLTPLKKLDFWSPQVHTKNLAQATFIKPFHQSPSQKHF